MSENVILALILLMGQIVVGFWTWMSNRALGVKLEVVRHQTNSMNEKLEAAAYKEGAADQRANPTVTVEQDNAKQTP